MSRSERNIATPASLLVSASAGCLAFGLLYLIGDKSKGFNHLLSVYPPSGALSGVLLFGTLLWLACWIVLSIRWRTRPPSAKFAINLAILLMLGALLLTFPPFVRGI